MRYSTGDGSRHQKSNPYITKEEATILKRVEEDTHDPTLAKSIWFGPTALTHIHRIVDHGGTIIADTNLFVRGIRTSLVDEKTVQVLSFIDDPRVVALAENRHVTRAEVAIDYCLSIPGPKLLVIGSAPAAIQRLLLHRQKEPMSEVCIFAAPAGFAGSIQLKERLMESDLASIVVRGNKGGAAVAIAVVNAILETFNDHAG